jgi:hypothetical protein
MKPGGLFFGFSNANLPLILPRMTTRRSFLTLMLAGLPLSSALAGGKKDPEVDISFHMEAEEGDNPKMTFIQLTAGKQLRFRRTSELNMRDVSNFNVFPSRDGEGYGLLLQLKPGAVNRIAAVTNINQNRWLLAMVNGRVVDAVIIDKPINDGQLVIWKGISQAEVGQLDETLPRIGEKKPRGKDGKKKKEN